jgi:hypothetical protein
MAGGHQIGATVRVNCPGNWAHGMLCLVRSGPYKYAGTVWQLVDLPHDQKKPRGKLLKLATNQLEIP